MKTKTKTPAKAKPWKAAKVILPIKASFTNWEVGERVWARKLADGAWLIEKLKPEQPFLSLHSQCFGMFRDALEVYR